MAQPVTLESPAVRWTRGLTTNCTASTTALANSTTEPVTIDASLLVLRNSGRPIQLQPFGRPNNGTNGGMTVWGIRKLGSDTSTILWCPVKLFVATIVPSLSVGVAGTDMVVADGDCDTITQTAGALPSSATDGYVVYSPADDTAGWVRLQTLGFEKIAVGFTIAATTTHLNMKYTWG